MAVTPWVGVRRIAIVPALNRQVDQEPPADWEYQVRSRVFYDPEPGTGKDRSFQHYLHALSYGRAHLDGEVFPRVWAEDAEVNVPAMRSLPPGHGYQALLAVLPHEAGEHRGGHAFGGISPVNGIKGWARVAMFSNPLLRDDQRQPIGVWGQELFHLLCDLWEHPGLPGYDPMDGDGARRSTHASATTKRLFGWLPAGVVDHAEGRLDTNLHAIGLVQPPPPDRVTAVRVPSRRAANRFFFVEGRLRTDPFDGMVPAEGVLVYEVNDTVKVTLRTGPSLSTGQTYDDPDEGLRVTVTDNLTGGFAVSVFHAPDPTVSGRLLRYVDASQTGGGDVSSPQVIGLGGWQQFRSLFSGADNVIYAVDQAGRLLRYVDASQTGGGDVSNPQIIGQGGWQQFRFLFPGADNVIYAVDQAGRLLRYVDASQTGGGDVSSPQVIGLGGWQQFRFLFPGTSNVIYAVIP
ncbi:tachylectin-related carbohydrate-binding protein [Micromonospora echinaurantiaca]|uniref:tachylectin-related carbohydrate-binding protein n=1 Tax=Micromonospora echinaurantiaca TaxID=47857 RepID=UPI00379DC337